MVNLKQMVNFRAEIHYLEHKLLFSSCICAPVTVVIYQLKVQCMCFVLSSSSEITSVYFPGKACFWALMITFD